MDKIVIPARVCGTVTAPPSKSYAQRIVAARYLAGLSSHIDQTTCDDISAALGVVGSLRSGADTLNVNESGLSARLFTPIAALGNKPVTITGRGSILNRPMGQMAEALRVLGVEVSDNDGFLPITVRGPMRGGRVELDGSVSSQFLTGLLMAAPLATEDTFIRVTGLRSTPYVDITLEVLRAFGVEVENRGYEQFSVRGGQSYRCVDVPIEGDWSAAACLLVAGAVAGDVTVRGLRADSLQADVRIVDALRMAGARVEQGEDWVRCREPKKASCLKPISFDATDCPDLFPALAALAAAADGVSTITGTDRLVHKESDRAQAIRTEFAKLNIHVDLTEANVMKIHGGDKKMSRSQLFTLHSSLFTHDSEGVVVDSHSDHRIAMALAVAGLRAQGPLTITGAECVDKSYANFWNDYEQLLQ